MKELITALVKFQQQVQKIPKDKKNPFFNSMYAPLDTVIDVCMPVLNKNGLAISQVMLVEKFEGGKLDVLVTSLWHETGLRIDSSIALPAINDPQKLTAAITYLRRSQYLAILGIVADDDLDGNENSGSIPKTPNTHPLAKSSATPNQVAALKKMFPGKDLTGITFEEASKLFAEYNRGK